MGGEVATATYRWSPGLDLALTFRLDGWSLLFALLITGIGSLVLVYAGDYLSSQARRGQFLLVLLLFQASMLGLVLSDNLMALFVFWELTGITSFLLIGFDHERPSAREAAQQALLVTGAGGLVLLAGLLLLGRSGGAWEISALAVPGVIDPGDAAVLVAFACIAIGAFTKSAQFPFHAWLPGAMAAPTPVSAYLHSATMVKAGVFLLGRMHPVLGEVAAWSWVLPIVGGVTMIIAAVVAIHETDLKRVLAYSTVSALGTMVFLLGIGSAAAVTAAVVFIVAHAFYKAALFMVAGGVDHATDTRDRAALSGLRRAMPLTALAAMLAGLSMVGLPPAAGFLAKESLLAAAIEEPLAAIATVAAMATGALTIVAVGIVVVGPFTGAPSDAARSAHEGGRGLWIPPLLLGAGGVALGLLMPFADAPLTAPVEAVLGTAAPVHLAFWHGFDLVLLLSILVVAAGAVGYGRLPILQRLLPLAPTSGDRAWAGLLAALNVVAVRHTRLIQNGSLRRYSSLVLMTASASALGVLAWQRGLGVPSYSPVGLDVFAVSVFLIISSVAAALARSRLRAMAATGVVGFGMALLFVFFSAPDLAMTQVLVDILIVVLFVAVFRHLPTVSRISPSRRARVRDASVAVAAGVMMTALAWTVLTLDGSRDVSTYFMESSQPLAHGRNVVNTILVDFRALDTLGEIVVLAVAAVGIVAVLRLRAEDDLSPAAPVDTTTGGRPRSPRVLRTVARFLISLLLMFAVFLFFRGHNEPGGGFVAGLVATAAVVLFAMAYGVPSAWGALRVDPRRLIWIGLLVAIGSGLAGALSGSPFLTGQWWDVPLGVGTLPVGTPLIFDLGVFLVVVGVAVTLALTMAEE